MRLPATIDRSSGRPVEATLLFEGTTRALHLTPQSLRAPTCVLEIVAPDGRRREEPLEPTTLWQGQVPAANADAPPASALAILDSQGHRFAAFLRDTRGWWSIVPLPSAGAAPAGEHAGSRTVVLASAADGLQQPLRCGTTAAEVAVAPPTTAPAAAAPRCPRRWSLAIELDAAAVERFGGRRQEAIAWAELLMGLVADELRRTSAVEVSIERFVCLEGAPATEPVAAGAVYADLWARWSARPEAERPTSVIHLTGRPLSDGSFGLSWIGGVAGGPAQRCAVVGVGAPASLLGRGSALLHLAGHLLGADHCGDGCGLMSGAWSEPPSPTLDARAAWQTLALVQAHEALPPATLPAPAGVSASDGTRCEGVEVAWAAVPDATSYELLRGPNTDGAAMEVVATVERSPWLDATAPPATPMRYQVRAKDVCRRSEPSAAVVGVAPAPVAAPTQIAASDGAGCADTTISWTEVPHARAYEVLRNAVNNPATAGAIGRSEQPRFVDAAPPPGVVWYWVRAIDGCGRPGPLSRGDSGFVGGLPPAPTGIAATDGTACGTVILTWNAVSGATSYTIWRSTSPDLGQAAQLAEVQASPFEDGAAPAGVELFYWIRAISACGKGPFGGPDRGRAAGSVPRIASIGDLMVPCGQPYQGPAPALSNAECAVPVEWSIASGPAGLLIAADGTVQWPNPVAGAHVITIAARNEAGVGQEQWTVHVQPLPPALAALPAVTVRCGEPLRLGPSAVTNAPCAGSVQWSLEAAPPGATVAADGSVAWTPAAPGTVTITLVAANAGGTGSTSCQVVVSVTAPQVSAPPPAEATEGVPWSGAAPSVTNAACVGPLRWTLVRAPEGVTLGQDGAPTWPTPQAGSFEIVVKASNDAGEAECASRLTVVARPAPVIAEIADLRAPCGTAWVGPTPALSNAEAAGGVTWSLGRAPEGAIIEPNGAVRWTAPRLGRHEFLLVATGSGGTDEESFVLIVEPTPPPPIAPVADAAAEEGATYELGLKVEESPCAGELTWSVLVGPEGLSVDERGVVRWAAATPGSHAIRIKVSNTAGESLVAWTLAVAAAKEEPPTPSTRAAGTAREHRPSRGR